MSTIDLIIVAVYLLAIVVVGLLVQKKASRDIDSYFLGSRKLPWWVLGASGMVSNTDIAGTMINTAFIYALGTKGFFIEIRGGVTLIMAFLMVFIIAWFIHRTKMGLVLRAVGNNPNSAHALGYSVVIVRFLAIMFGGFMAGLGGSFLPLVLTPHWAEGMTAGKGWIALALVVFASWRPLRVPLGALLFSGITVMQLVGQARGWSMPSQFLPLPHYQRVLPTH